MHLPPEPPLPTGRINVNVGSLSFATKSMGDNSGGVALLWARVPVLTLLREVGAEHRLCSKALDQ